MADELKLPPGAKQVPLPPGAKMVGFTPPAGVSETHNPDLPDVTNQDLARLGRYLPAVGATAASIFQPELLPASGWLWSTAAAGALAAAGGAGGAAINQEIEKVAGLPGAPKTAKESFSRMGKEALEQGALEVGGRAVAAPFELGLSAIGRKIQASTIRPRLADVRDGFKWETLDRFKLKGNLEQSLQQVDTELSRLRAERNAMLSPGVGQVDMKQIFDEAERELGKDVGNLKFAGQGQKAREALESLRDDVLASSATGGTVDLRAAENAKEAFGKLGAWSYGRSDPESAVTEQVANRVYFKMKEAIEKALANQGPRVKVLNKQMQDLIPVKNAMLARIPVEERNNIFSLGDIAAMIPAALSGNVAELGLVGLSKAQRSTRFGNWLVRNKGLGRLGREVPAVAARAEAATIGQ